MQQGGMNNKPSLVLAAVMAWHRPGAHWSRFTGRQAGKLASRSAFCCARLRTLHQAVKHLATAAIEHCSEYS